MPIPTPFKLAHFFRQVTVVAVVLVRGVHVAGVVMANAEPIGTLAVVVVAAVVLKTCCMGRRTG